MPAVRPAVVRGQGGSMTLIEDKVLGAASATIDFQSIPATYKALRFMTSLRTTEVAVGENVLLNFNNDVSASYYYEVAAGVGAFPLAFDTLAAAYSWFGFYGASGGTAPAGSVALSTILIPNYTSGVFAKTFIAKTFAPTSEATGEMVLSVAGAQWYNAAAIDRITLTVSSTFVPGSRATLYGLG